MQEITIKNVTYDTLRFHLIHLIEYTVFMSGTIVAVEEYGMQKKYKVQIITRTF